MKILNIFTWFLLCMTLTGLSAQNSPVSAGGVAANGLITVCYSVGQVTYKSKKSLSFSVNEGVQQPYEFFITGIVENSAIEINCTAFPNPTISSLKLNIKNQSLNNLSLQLFDLNGKLLLQQKIYDDETSIQMESYPSAIYFLKVCDKNILVQEFKILKNK